MAHSEKMEDRGFDVDTGMVCRGRGLMQNTALGPIFLSLAPSKGQSSKDYDRFFNAECDRILKIAETSGLIKIGYNPNQPRIPSGQTDGGEWTDEGQSGNQNIAVTGPMEDIADYWWATPADKQQFVDTHLAAAQKAAGRLGVPVENVLGFAALESRWGRSRFATEGNNYFNLYAAAPLKSGEIKALDSDNVLARFDNPATSFASFALDSMRVVKGAKNVQKPDVFATVLQSSGKYGIDTDTGEPVAGFVDSTARTIIGLRPYIARRAL